MRLLFEELKMKKALNAIMHWTFSPFPLATVNYFFNDWKEAETLIPCFLTQKDARINRQTFIEPSKNSMGSRPCKNQWKTYLLPLLSHIFSAHEVFIWRFFGSKNAILMIKIWFKMIETVSCTFDFLNLCHKLPN